MPTKKVAQVAKEFNCPHCNAEIDQLVAESHEIVPYRVKLSGDELDYTPHEKLEPEVKGDDVFICPECFQPIAHNEQDAIAFLKEGKLPQR